ncbi:hypothetical protein [Roseicyclus persicicus]|uniref:Uncharacterized protein n=1 Tax=Roseicyclus persicicus TaxID=2650661 RepID=A0A7X6GXW6_9RHOB|nr:hypothetical protein [Roseibacterium persicicum]NKX44432.1 hypothetical protein [Roseibacterium persicicum]
MRDCVEVDISGPVAQLEGLLARATLSPKDAARCARLAEALRRPARLCLLGPDPALLHWLLAGLIGEAPVAAGQMPPALEVSHGEAPRTVATLGDGSTLARPGLPQPDMLARAPVFLAVEAPVALLRRMSVLAVCLDVDPAQHVPALAWAARRSEIALWCTASFGPADARIWAAAPDRLHNHAVLVERAPAPTPPRLPAGAEFVARFAAGPAPDDGAAAPRALVAALQERLLADMDEARAADLDATRLFLHRLGSAVPAPAAAVAPRAAPAADAAPSAGMRALVSEPLLYLTRRARALAQALAWPDEGGDWAAEVLDGCCETAEGLRDRAADWPEDDPAATALRQAIEEMGDTALLLQIEGGAEAAETAAALMGQMRWELEQALARSPAPDLEPGVGR